VTIPNGSLANNVVKNYSSYDTRRVLYKIGVSYDADIRLTKRLIEEIVRSSGFTLLEKEIFVAVDELSDNAVVVLVRFRVESSVYFDAFH
jgi:small conductance mechanosensitive channel